MRLAGHGFKRLLVCEAAGARSGRAAASACIGAVDPALTRAFAAAESAGGCTTTGDATVVAGELASAAATLAQALRPQAASRCAANMLRAMAIAGDAMLGARAADYRRPNAGRLATRLGKISSRLQHALDAPCARSIDSSGAKDLFDAGVKRVVGELVIPNCGDDLQSPGEQCDGTDIAQCTPFGPEGGDSCGLPGNPDACRCCVKEGSTCVNGGPPCCAGSTCLTDYPPIYGVCAANSCSTNADCAPGTGFTGPRFGEEKCVDGKCCQSQLGVIGSCNYVFDCCAPARCFFWPPTSVWCCLDAGQPCTEDGECCMRGGPGPSSALCDPVTKTCAGPSPF
jgi:hypothetical protein